MSTSKIEIRNLTVDYIEKKKNFTALKNVSFPINDGEFVSIIVQAAAENPHWEEASANWKI